MIDITLPDIEPGELIEQPGLYRTLPRAYHADPSKVPSLSSSIAKHLVNRTPRHAWHNHPRLNPFHAEQGVDDEIKRKTAFGAACHELFLDIGCGIHIIGAVDKDGEPVTDYRTNAAKAERDKAIGEGKVPVRVDEYDEALIVVDEAKRQVQPWLDMSGESEVMGIAHFSGVVTRFMCDRLSHDQRTMFDLKFTKTDASIAEWPQHAARMGYHIQAGHYRSSLAQILSVDVRHIQFLFVVIELGPPVLAIVHELPAGMAEIGLEKAEQARATWGHCLINGMDQEHWPGYPQGIHCGDNPAWLAAQHETQMALARMSRKATSTADGAS